jgi:hypothetical protein
MHAKPRRHEMAKTDKRVEQRPVPSPDRLLVGSRDLLHASHPTPVAHRRRRIDVHRVVDRARLPTGWVIDEQGVVRHRHDHLLGLHYQSVDELKAALDALPTAPAAA